MTDTKLIAREPTEKMVQTAANVYLTGMSGDIASDMRMVIIVAHDAAPDLAPAPSPSEPTLRQRYAMAAMQGAATQSHGGRWSHHDVARECFAWADAMIAAEGER